MAFPINPQQILSGFDDFRESVHRYRQWQKTHDMFGRTERFCWIWCILALVPWAGTRFVLRGMLQIGYGWSALFIAWLILGLALVLLINRQYHLRYYAIGTVLALLLSEWAVWCTFYGRLPFDPWVVHFNWAIDTPWSSPFGWNGYLTPGLLLAVVVSVFWARKQPEFRPGVTH